MASTHTVQLNSEQGSSLPVSIKAQLQYGDGAKLQLKEKQLTCFFSVTKGTVLTIMDVPCRRKVNDSLRA